MPNETNASAIINDGWNQLSLYIIYVVQGLMVGGLNLIAVGAIWKQEALKTRNEYIIIAAKSFADAVGGIAYVVGGTYYIYLVLSSRHSEFQSIYTCLWMPHQILFAIGGPLFQIMATVVSVDRLYCVAFPEHYLGQTEKYATYFTGTVMALCILIGFPLPLIISFFHQPSSLTVPIKCRPAVVQTAVHLYLKYWFIYFGLLMNIVGVLMYIPVVICYKRMHKRATTNDQHFKAQVKKQRKLTRSLTLSAAVTLFLWIIPVQVAFALLQKGWVALSTVVFILANFDPIVNVGILLKRHREIRKAVLALFSWHTLPPELELWTMGNQVASTIR